MSKSSRWFAVLAIVAMLTSFLMAGTLTALAQGTEQEQEDGVVTLEEAPRVTPADLAQDGRSAELVEPEPVGSVGSFEAVVWDDSWCPDGFANEGLVGVDGLNVNLYIKRPDGSWKPYGTKVTGSEPVDFYRYLPLWIPWINPPHEHGWVGWDHLPTNYTGVEAITGEGGQTNNYPYADYKMELIPTAQWLPTNDTVRYGRLYEVQWMPFQWACALWYYPQSAYPSTRGFGVRVPPSKIGGYVFHDKNADGKMSSREPLLKGWTVILTSNLVEIARTTTDSNGRYEFKGLDPGYYQVWEASRWGWKQIFYYYNPIVPRPSGVDKGNHFIFVNPKVDYLDCNFGNLRMDSICDMFYYNKFLIKLVAYWLGLGLGDASNL